MCLLYGFSKEKNYLVNNCKNKSLHSSIIISGQKGIGKKKLIYTVIKEIVNFSVDKKIVNHYINLINTNSHPNIRYLSKEFDEKTNKNKSYITINQIRNLNSFIYESSLDDFYKFVIIDSADDLNINASNSLLKILEDPPNNTYFFLISHQLSSLLNTIRSRCLKLKLQNHDFDIFKLIIKKKINNIHEESIKFLFDLSKGSPGVALDFHDEDVYNLYNKILYSLVDKNPLSKNNIDLSSQLSKFSNDKFKIFILLFKFILINLSKIKIGINIFDQYLSNNLNLLVNLSNNISNTTILNRLEYLIKNENDLFAYNLDKNFFIMNFFLEIEK